MLELLELASPQAQTYMGFCASHLNRSCVLVRVLQEPKQRSLEHAETYRIVTFYRYLAE